MGLKKNKVCILYNFPQHYRFGIFNLIGNSTRAHFYFGDKMDDVVGFETNLLKGKVFKLKNFKLCGNIYIQLGAFPIFFNNYSKYIVLGEYYNFTTWFLLFYIYFFKKRKIFLWTHGWYGNETIIKKNITKFFFNLADGILLYGDKAKEKMIMNGFCPQKLHVIYNSLNYNLILKIRTKLKQKPVLYNIFGNNNPTIFFIGRLTKIKNIKMIIQASEKMNKISFSHNVLIIGEGEDFNFLNDYVKIKKLKNIFFYGPSYDELETAELIYNSDLCVSPGNVGLTAIHSLSYGTPVLTHNNFSNQMPEHESINPNFGTGDYFEEGNLDSMVEKILFLISKQKNKRNDIRKACFRVIDEKYNPPYQLKVLRNANAI